MGLVWCQRACFQGNILPPFTVLTKGTQQETVGKFVAKPVALFSYPPGVSTFGCGLELAFRVNFTFALMPQSGTAWSSGFAFVIVAKPKAGKPGGVGYSGVGPRSIAVVFDTLQDDAGEQHVGLSINGAEEPFVKEVSPFAFTDGNSYTVWVDYEPGDPSTIQVFLANSNVKPVEPLLQRNVSLCAVLQPGVKHLAFSFGFVASTTVKPFQLHGILFSSVQIGKAFLGQVVLEKDACWAYAVVASVEAAYGIAKQQSAPRLAVEALFTLMGLSDSDKCSAGGSPTHALETLVALDATSGLPGASDPATTYPVQAFERAQFKGYVGLMLAVQRQPVVVHVEASAPTFMQYDGDPGCYTGSLNHVVLVIGYFITRNDGSQNRIAPPFWIIRNSWGEEWGQRGHMRMDIQGGDGVCGINVLPGIYPIVKSKASNTPLERASHIYTVIVPGDPCGESSYKGDGDSQPSMNPCGRFQCQGTAASSNYCTCNIPTSTVQPFVEVANGIGSTCAYVDVCGSYFKNPCYVGACINDGKGSYSCICPPNHIPSTTVDGFPTCDPANTTATTMTVSGDNWLCSDVHPLVGLSLTDFTDQNAGIDCNQPLPKGSVLQLDGTPATPCTAFFYSLNDHDLSMAFSHIASTKCHFACFSPTIQGDTCASITPVLSLNEASLAALNPGLDCSESIKAGRSVCLERNATFAFTVPECVRYGTLTPQDTCDRLIQRTSNSQGGASASEKAWAALYRNNPGLTCSATIPSSASAVGTNIGVQVRIVRAGGSDLGDGGKNER
ncbi:unnamed protein product [Closterium sp. Naga37s-1]|nr:unnamed protein product [Closterium sp. Naga37s-1]